MASGSSYTSKTISREPINTRPLIPARASREWQVVKVKREEPETDQVHLNTSKTCDAVRWARRERTPLRFTPAPSHTRSIRALTYFVLLLLLLVMVLPFTFLSKDSPALLYWLGESGQPVALLVEQTGGLSVGKPEAQPLHLVGSLPSPNSFGPKIEGYASYVPQSTCDPVAKPGVLAFRDMFINAFPGTGSLGITRACDIGGTSEHKEGRAFDWAVSALDPSGVATANRAFAWLFATDKYGNQDAMIRRLGIMYMVWNHHIWSAWMLSAGWRPYNGPNPHINHVHFSFSWDGANKNTSFWNPSNSF